MTSSSSSFLQQVQQEWEQNIKPIIEDVYESITQIIEKTTNNPNIFRKCEPVDLYTQIYNMTIHQQFDFCHLDFLYHQEIDSIKVFCSRFQIHTLSEMNRQILGFKILLKWFHVFFHHLNRLRHRSYLNSYSIDEDMVYTIRKYYLKPQLPIISQLICSKWAKIRNNQYIVDSMLFESMNLISFFHPHYHNDQLLSLYFKRLREFSQRKSDVWYSQDNVLFYMKNVNHCFEQEKKMFCHYFSQQENLEEVYTILKKSFIYPFCDSFLQNAQYGWKSLLLSNHMPYIQTAYQYFCWMEDPSLWLFLYQQFLEEKIASFLAEAMVDPLAMLLKQQTHLLEEVFTDEKLRIRFTTTLGKSIQKAMTDNGQVVVDLVKTIHHHIPKKSSKQRLQDLSALVAFCPVKDLFYDHYHYFLKTRLLLGRHHLPHEKMMLNIFCTKLGMSFVLNLRLMIQEIQKNCVSHGQYSLNKLSSVVWKLDNDKPLQYKIPIIVQTNLKQLYDRMKKGIQSSKIQLKMLWHQGVVVLARNGSDFYMSPIQAIVLMALEMPQTREQLVQGLQIEDDVHHNLDGVLESLSKAMLIVKKEDDNQWCWYTHSTQRHSITRVIVPPIKKAKQNHQDCGHTLGPIVMHAFIVKTLKQEKIMKYFQLMDLVSKRYKARLVDVKHSIETLIEQEYLSKDEENKLRYIP